MGFLRNLIAGLITLTIIAFVLMNRQDIDVTWSPIHQSLTLPLYIIITGSLLTGFLIGAFVVWFNDGTLRKTKREQKKQIKSLQKEIENTKTSSLSQTLPNDFFPSLPRKSNNA